MERYFLAAAAFADDQENGLNEAFRSFSFHDWPSSLKS
jgi:hypothetical protein